MRSGSCLVGHQERVGELARRWSSFEVEVVHEGRWRVVRRPRLGNLRDRST